MERKQRIDNEILTAADKTYFYTAATTDAVQLTTRQQIVRIANAHAFTLSLPSVAEAKGLTFVISVNSATAAVTLADLGDSVNWEGDYTLDAAEDRIALKSDGREWIEIENAIA